MLRSLSLSFFFYFFLVPFLSAHGDLHEQIEQTSKRIQQDPDNAGLYLKRGQLYAQHEDCKLAIKDYQKARSLNEHLLVTDLLLANVLLKNKQAKEALVHASIFLKNQPGDVDGLLSRASIYQQLKQEELAEQDLKMAFYHLEKPLPKHYISIAEATLRADYSNVEEALAWLRKGQDQFGFDIVLKEKEIELLTQNGQYRRALDAVDDVLKRFQRKEKWLFKKGQILEKANQPEAAVNLYSATLQAIQNLPRRLQSTGKMLELEVLTLQNIQRLSE